MTTALALNDIKTLVDDLHIGEPQPEHLATEATSSAAQDRRPSAVRHVTDRYANNAVEADRGRLKARLHPMRGLQRSRSAANIAGGHAFVQNLR